MGGVRYEAESAQITNTSPCALNGVFNGYAALWCNGKVSFVIPFAGTSPTIVPTFTPTPTYTPTRTPTFTPTPTNTPTRTPTFTPTPVPISSSWVTLHSDDFSALRTDVFTPEGNYQYIENGTLRSNGTNGISWPSFARNSYTIGHGRKIGVDIKPDRIGTMAHIILISDGYRFGVVFDTNGVHVQALDASGYLSPEPVILTYSANVWYRVELAVDDVGGFRAWIRERDNANAPVGSYTRTMPANRLWKFQHWGFAGTVWLDNYAEQTRPVADAFDTRNASLWSFNSSYQTVPFSSGSYTLLRHQGIGNWGSAFGRSTCAVSSGQAVDVDFRADSSSPAAYFMLETNTTPPNWARWAIRIFNGVINANYASDGSTQVDGVTLVNPVKINSWYHLRLTVSDSSGYRIRIWERDSSGVPIADWGTGMPSGKTYCFRISSVSGYQDFDHYSEISSGTVPMLAIQSNTILFESEASARAPVENIPESEDAVTKDYPQVEWPSDEPRMPFVPFSPAPDGQGDQGRIFVPLAMRLDEVAPGAAKALADVAPNAVESPQATRITIRKYYSLGGRRVAMREIVVGQSNTLTWLFADQLSSTSVAINAATGAQTHMRYMPYGAPRLAGPLPTDHTFTGQRNEAGTGLMDYGARFYDPLIGRFISADTIVPGAGNPQALNRYTYAFGNSLKYTDPSGHSPCGGKSGDDFWQCRWYTAHGYEYQQGKWNTCLGCAEFEDIGILSDVLGEHGIGISGSSRMKLSAHGNTVSRSDTNWRRDELEDATRGVIDLARAVGGVGRFKELIGGYALFKRVDLNSIGTDNPCVCGLMLASHVIEFTNGWAGGNSQYRRTTAVHELAHVIAFNYSVRVPSYTARVEDVVPHIGQPVSTYAASNSLNLEYWADSVMEWIYPGTTQFHLNVDVAKWIDGFLTGKGW